MNDPINDDFRTQLQLSRRLHRPHLQPGLALVAIGALTYAAAFASPLVGMVVLTFYGLALAVSGLCLILEVYDRAREFIDDHSLEEQGEEIVARPVDVADGRIVCREERR